MDPGGRIGQPVFFGTHNHAIDAKGRTSLPVRFRDTLAAGGEKRIWLMRSPHSRSVMALPDSLWTQVARTVSGSSPFDGLLQKNIFKFLSTAQEIELDPHGRVLVPPALREWAGLSKEVVWVGMGPTIGLFDQATYEAEMAAELPPEQRIDILKHGA